jgi:hypothetical protein
MKGSNRSGCFVEALDALMQVPESDRLADGNAAWRANRLAA